MLMFGPASTFNAERCESFNGTIRAHNIYANRHAPSKDIATSFAIQQSIQFVCSGGYYDPLEKCGEDLIRLYRSSEVEDFLAGERPHMIESLTFTVHFARSVQSRKLL
ncbi:hypothetical protein EMCRGX_G022609 [Ephydatia muelleri]